MTTEATLSFNSNAEVGYDPRAFVDLNLFENHTGFEVHQANVVTNRGNGPSSLYGDEEEEDLLDAAANVALNVIDDWGEFVGHV